MKQKNVAKNIDSRSYVSSVFLLLNCFFLLSLPFDASQKPSPPSLRLSRCALLLRPNEPSLLHLIRTSICAPPKQARIEIKQKKKMRRTFTRHKVNSINTSEVAIDSKKRKQMSRERERGRVECVCLWGILFCVLYLYHFDFSCRFSYQSF